MIRDSRNCFFKRKSQYTIKKAFKRMSTGTPRLSTDSKGNAFGGTCGNRYEKSNAVAAKEFSININLSNSLRSCI